ncbi:MAG: hypothetical protein M1816_001847 [Peltula sp. TS41687]|nr:MAG: hypothetical protein M1816_001847 [Peltula sp. TS41687]
MDSIIFYEPPSAHIPASSNKSLTSDDTSTVQTESVAQRSKYDEILTAYDTTEYVDMSGLDQGGLRLDFTDVSVNVQENTDSARAGDTYNEDDLSSVSELLSCTGQTETLTGLSSSADYKLKRVSDQFASPINSRPGNSQDKPILLDDDQANCAQTSALESVQAASTGCIKSVTPPTPSNCSDYDSSDIQSDDIFDIFAEDDNGGNCKGIRPAKRQKLPLVCHNPLARKTVPDNRFMLRQDNNGRGRDTAADFDGMVTEGDSSNISSRDVESLTSHDSLCMKRKRRSNSSPTLKRSKVLPSPNYSGQKFRGTGTAPTLKTDRQHSSSSSTDTEETASRASPVAEDDSGPPGAWPFQGFLGCQVVGSEQFLTIHISKEYLHHFLPSQVSLSSRKGATIIAKKARTVTSVSQRRRTWSRFTPEEDKRLIELKNQGLSWKAIQQQHFKERSIGTLQVHYCTKLQKQKRE